MNTIQKKNVRRIALTATLAMTLVALLAGCEASEQTPTLTENQSTENQATVDQPGADDRAMGDVAEFDDFTIRANVSPTEHLPAAMARQYDIEAGPSLALLSVVILEKRPGQQPVPVPGKVNAQYETLVGQATSIEMRAVEANDLVSHIGTLDTSAQRIFRFVIEAQPQGTDQPMQMHFEVQLPELEVE